MVEFGFYRFSARYVSRRTNANIIALAAYSSGTTLECRDPAFGTRDYSWSGREDVVASYVIAPDGAPAWMSNREELWNRIARREKRKDARVARDMMLCLPKELTHEQANELVRRYVSRVLVGKYGMVADVALHDKGDGNPHAHVLTTLRRVEGEDFGKRDNELISKRMLIDMRREWAYECNQAFSRGGLNLFVSASPKGKWKQELKQELHQELRLQR